MRPLVDSCAVGLGWFQENGSFRDRGFDAVGEMAGFYQYNRNYSGGQWQRNARCEMTLAEMTLGPEEVLRGGF